MQSSASRPAPPAPAAPAPEHKPEKVSASKAAKATPEWLRILSVVLLAGIVVILIGITFVLSRSSAGDSENQFVNTGKYQAVFLNNGQVYFGNIKDLNSSFVRMTNIYYLTQGSSSSSSTSSSNNNYSLVKLGCQQIHDPLDEMVINRDQVTFWENLNSSGKVVSSIKQFQQQNPNGPDCSQVSSQTQASSSNAQGSTSDTSTNSSSSH